MVRGLAATLTRAVEILKVATDTVQVDVLVERCTGEEKVAEKKVGRRVYAAAVVYKAVLGKDIKFVVAEGATQGIQVSSVQFLEPLEITTRDRLTLPDGTHPQIMSVHGATCYPGGAYFAPKVLY